MSLIGPCSWPLSRLLSRVFNPSIASVANASGRWWPQPELRSYSNGASTSVTEHSGSNDVVTVKTSKGDVTLRKADAAPVYAKPRGDGNRDAFRLVPWKNGEQLANYVLFEESMQRSKVPWNDYSGLTSEERTIYMAHLRAVEERKLKYKDPKTGYVVMTVSQLLSTGKCCGNGCRHCPYQHENASDEVKKSRVWNGAFYV